MHVLCNQHRCEKDICMSNFAIYLIEIRRKYALRKSQRFQRWKFEEENQLTTIFAASLKFSVDVVRSYYPLSPIPYPLLSPTVGSIVGNLKDETLSTHT